MVAGSETCDSFNISWKMDIASPHATSYMLLLNLTTMDLRVITKAYPLTSDELSPIECIDTCVMDITGLVPGTMAQAALQAVNAEGSSRASAYVSTSTLSSIQCTPPPPPPSLDVTPTPTPTTTPTPMASPSPAGRKPMTTPKPYATPPPLRRQYSLPAAPRPKGLRALIGRRSEAAEADRAADREADRAKDREARA